MGGVIHSRSLPLFLAIAACGLSSPVAAEFRVLESNVKKYPAGAVFPDDERFELGQGCVLRVIVLPSNETCVLEGAKPRRLATGGTRGKPPPPACQ
jgi:hypothetical protein